jgi:hypothetical protein
MDCPSCGCELDGEQVNCQLVHCAVCGWDGAPVECYPESPIDGDEEQDA